MIDQLIFGRPKRRRDLTPGPHAGFRVCPLQLSQWGGVNLQGWRAVPRGAQGPGKVLIYFGGRMEDVWWAPQMASYLDGWTIYAFNYRGFGDSQGAPSEKSAKADALAIYQVVKSLHSEAGTEFVVMGRSLGTAVAIWLAHRVRPAKLVLVSPFCSIRTVLLARPWSAPLSLLAGRRFTSALLAPEISARTLIVLADKDRQIPHADSLKLARTFATRPQVVKIRGTDHRTVPRNVETQRALADFLGSQALSG